jgi:hypothetical protein
MKILRIRNLLWAAPVCLLPFVPACSCAGDASHSETGDIGPKEEHELNCNCIVNFDGVAQTFGGAPASVSFDFANCLPPDLNTATADATQLAALNALSDADYTTAVTDYCGSRVGMVITSVIGLLNGGACDHFTVECVPLPLAGGVRATNINPICDLPCELVTCDPEVNCDGDAVIDDEFNVHPELCKCTQSTGCATTSEVFCARPPGNADPPTIASGLLTTLMSSPIVIDLDHALSQADVHVDVDIGIDTVSDTQHPHINGKVVLYGRPCPGSSCDMLMDMSLFPDNFTLDFGLIVGSHSVEKVTIIGGTWHTYVHIDSDGTGHIPAGVLQFTADGILDGTERHGFTDTNDTEILFHIDFTTNAFTLSGLNAAFPDASGTVNLVGTIRNQPPTASAGSDQSIECTSPAGAFATLDGSASSDPDGDIMRIHWWNGPALEPAAFLGSGATFGLTSPLGATSYKLSISDQHFLTSVDTSIVTVVDTTAPVVTPPPDVLVECSASSGQAIEIGTATIDEVCDASPSLASDAPAQYSLGVTTVHWSSTDASGNTGTADQQVTVQDTTPPSLTVSVSPTTIWPPNKNLIPVTVTALATDICDTSIPITLVSAVATEPGENQPIPANAIQGATIGTADFSFSVVADRSGTAPQGRFYTFTYDAVDDSGNHTLKSVTVNVPHQAP